MTPQEIKGRRLSACLSVTKASALTGITAGRIKGWEAQKGAKHSRNPCKYALAHYVSVLVYNKIYED